MKTTPCTLCGLTAVLLLGLTTLTFAQNDMDAARKQMYDDITRQAMRYDILSGHNANLDVLQLLSYDYVREGIGIPEKQAQKIQKEVTGTSYLDYLKNDPEYISLQEEMNGKYNPFNPDATEETLKKFAELHIQWSEMVPNLHLRLIDENLTPEQKQKFNEFHISYMSETEYVFPGMFAALDLSDEQKKQFGEVQKRMETELDKHIDIMIERNSKWKEKIEEKLKAVIDPEEREKLRMDIIGGRNDIYKQIWAELQPETDKMMQSGKELADELKIKMFDVLTDEQWDRMIDLIDNPPDYVKRIIASRKPKENDAHKDDANKPEAWTPGPNSWRPGDPVPEEYRQERNQRRRFPRTEE
jgi:Ni/Co efflux regulator RcnB